MPTSTVIKKLSIAVAGIATIAIAMPLSAAAATLYSITDLGNISPTAINNRGQVVGCSVTPSGYSRAVIWENGIITDLGTPGSNYSDSRATDINDLGQVVGNSYNNAGRFERAFLWDKGKMIDLGILGSNDISSQANGINNRGQVVGTILYNSSENRMGRYRGFLWENGTMTELLPGSQENCFRSHSCYGYSALGINDAGQVVGYSGHPMSMGSPARAFVLQNGWINDLGLYLNNYGGYWSTAKKINNAGQVVAVTFVPYYLPLPFHNGGVFLLENCSAFPGSGQRCKVTDLGNTDGEYTSVVDINDVGQIIGPFGLWENGIVTAPNSLLPKNSGWESLSLLAINNSGQIVGSGSFHGKGRGFLMTPGFESVPEPNLALGLLAFGAFGAGAMVKRQRQGQAWAMTSITPQRSRLSGI